MEDKKDNDKEIIINLSKIKKFFRKKKKGEVKKSEEDMKENEQKLKKTIIQKEEKVDELRNDKVRIDKAETAIQQDEKSAGSVGKEKEIFNRDVTEVKEKNWGVKDDLEKEEGITIDFSKVKSLFKKIRKEEPKIEKTKEISAKEESWKKEDSPNGKKETTPKEESDEHIHIDLKKIKNIFKGKGWGVFSKKYGLLLVILIPMFFSIYFRMYPSYLPITDDWAKSSVYNSYKSQIASQIQQQYPNLPESNKNALVNTEFEKVLESQKNQIGDQIRATSDYFKSRFKNDDGQTYLLAIDPYLWYGQARNYVNYGHPGDKKVNNTSVYSLRNGRFGKGISGFKLHPFLEASLYKVVNLFNNKFTLLRAAFLMPVILITLAVIPVFFITKKFGGIVGGLFASLMLAINSSLLGRTPAGFSDTDAYNILIPLLVVWVFLEAFETKNLKKKIILTVTAGFITGIYPLVWIGWSYIFNFILGTVGIFLLYTFIRNFKELKKGIVRYIKSEPIKEVIIIMGTYLLSVGVFVSWFTNGVNNYFSAFTRLFKFITLKEVAVKTLWPNVLTTVAEFNPPQLGDIINHMGGRFLFLIAIVGIILTLIKKDNRGRTDVKYAALLTIWFLGTAYSFTKGVRFAILMVPAFAIALGIAIGIVYQYLSKIITKELHVNKYFSRISVFILVSLLLLSPLRAANKTALNEIPSMCDSWYESLTAIKDDSEDAIITSWWDFGHWFTAIAERKVTFDGGDQQRRIHWVGKSLLTSDEKLNIGILRMLNCGQENAFDELDSYINDTIKSIDILNEIILLNRTEARGILLKNGLKEKEADNVLELTHCDDLINQYYITSEDMIGKAGVWAHFGSWDFKKAKMWQTVRGKDYDDGTGILQKEFNLTPEMADGYYYEIQNTKADNWISPWPSFRSGFGSCSKNGEILNCNNGAVINLTTHDAELPTQEGIKYPSSFVYNTDYDLVEKEYDEESIAISVILVKEGESYKSLLTDPLLAKSMFVRLFFFNGLGSKHYKLLSDKTTVIGQRVIVWVVDWEEHEPITMEEKSIKAEETPEEEVEEVEKEEIKEAEEKNKTKAETGAEEGDTASVVYIGWLENETIFDSSIIGWENENISKDTELTEDLEYNPFSFTLGTMEVIPGFDEAVLGMRVNETKIVKISPENAYGLDTGAHPLGNKTLNFKIKLIKIE